jgi:hypothetical protein
MPSYGNVNKRIMYFERLEVSSHPHPRIFLKPYCQVSFAGWNNGNGKLWEPRDMVRNSMIQNDEKKEVNSIEEWNPKGKLLQSEIEPEGVPITLHSFGGWDWPSTG